MAEVAVKMSEKETRALMMTFTKAKRDEMKDHLIPYDDFGVTPLHIAAKFGHTKLAHRLVQWGADVNKVEEVRPTYPRFCPSKPFLITPPSHHKPNPLRFF